MNPLVTKAAPWAISLLLASGLFAGFVAHERRVGRLQVQLASADSLSRAAQAEAHDWQRRAEIDSGRAAALEADTARANARLRQAEGRYAALSASLAGSRHTLDSLLALPHDTASTALYGAAGAYVARADSTLRACADGLTAADAALAACQRHGQAVQAHLVDVQAMAAALAKDTTAKALQLKAIRGQVPGFFAVWLPRLAAFGLGVLAGRIGR